MEAELEDSIAPFFMLWSLIEFLSVAELFRFLSPSLLLLLSLDFFACCLSLSALLKRILACFPIKILLMRPLNADCLDLPPVERGCPPFLVPFFVH